MPNNFTAIILAAGEGTRMKSGLPKVLHQVCGRPMLSYVLDLAKALGAKNTLVVTGYKRELLKDLISQYKAKEVYQDKRLGTADAIKRCQPALRGLPGNIIVLYGDQPLLKKETLQELIQRHIKTKACATILSAYPENPFGYGRIARDNFSRIRAIVEEKDASPEQKEIKEINTGIICFKKEPLFKAIARIRPDNAKKEYYLTDAIKILAQEGELIESVSITEDVQEAQGINSRIDLAQAVKAMRCRILEKHMLEGVTIVDPDTTYMEEGVRIGRDTVIYPFTFIEKDVIIGDLCQIGPFCHLRPETVIEDRATVGNFTEITRSRLGRDSFMKHFSYLGDTIAGKAVNIGCGAVVANFDGKNKNQTIIEDQAFIGSDTVLRAPVRIGRKAVTGAGSVVTRDVAAGTVVAGVPARILKGAQGDK